MFIIDWISEQIQPRRRRPTFYSEYVSEQLKVKELEAKLKQLEKPPKQPTTIISPIQVALNRKELHKDYLLWQAESQKQRMNELIEHFNRDAEMSSRLGQKLIRTYVCEKELKPRLENMLRAYGYDVVTRRSQLTKAEKKEARYVNMMEDIIVRMPADSTSR